MNLIFIFGAKYLWVISGVVVATYFLRQPRAKQREMVVFGAIIGAIALALAFIAGHIYYDPRPFIVGGFQPLIPHGADNGFPSDHALIAAAAAVFMGAYSRRIAIALWAIAILVGISRVYVGVHHAIDVIGSIAICVVAGALAGKIQRRRSARKSETPTA